MDNAMKHFASGGCVGWVDGVPAMKLRAAPTYAGSSNIIGAVEIPTTRIARLTRNTIAYRFRVFIGGSQIQTKGLASVLVFQGG
jgi:hypothetical protein